VRDLAIDLGFAGQALRSRLLWSAGIVFNLALVLGTATGLFGLYLGATHPIAARRPDRVLTIGADTPGAEPMRVSPGLFAELRSRCRSFTAIEAARNEDVFLDQTRYPLLAAVVSPGWLAAVDPGFALGAGFAPGDHAAAAAPVALISHGLWQGRFDGARDAVGRELTLRDGRRFRIRGVLGAAFEASTPEARALDLWLPGRDMERPASPRRADLLLVGRLADGVSPAAARSELDEVVRGLAGSHPDVPRGTVAALDAFSPAAQEHGAVLGQLFLSAMLFLLVGVTTVAVQFLGRSLSRRRDHAVRLAIGAPRHRLVRQTLLEAGLLALLGTLPGLLVATAWMRVLQATYLGAARVNPGFREAGLDLPVLLFAGVLAASVAVLIALPVALRLTSMGVLSTLKRSARGHTGSRSERWWREGLLGAQMVVLTLLCVQGLFFSYQVEGVVKLQRFDGVVHLGVRAPASDGPDERAQIKQALMARLARLAEVEGVVLVTPPPGSAGRARVPHQVQLAAPVSGRPANGAADVRTLDGELSNTLGVSLLSGRMLDRNDQNGQPAVAVVDRRFVQHFLGAAHPLGRQIELPDAGPLAPEPLTIVGVVSDFVLPAAAPGLPTIYLPDTPRAGSTLDFAVRVANWTAQPGRVARGQALARVRSAAGEVVPDRVVAEANPYSDLFFEDVFLVIIQTMVLFVLIIVAAVLSTIALVDVGRALVNARRGEFAVRLAIGASPARVFSLVMLTSWLPITVGVALGAGLSLAWLPPGALTANMVRMMALMVATSPITLGVIMLWPAWRASRVPVMATLRHE
jgi:predicted permease